MLRAAIIQLIAALLIASALALLAPPPARAQSAKDIHGLNRQVAQLFHQGLYTEALELAERTLLLAENSLGPGGIAYQAGAGGP